MQKYVQVKLWVSITLIGLEDVIDPQTILVSHAHRVAYKETLQQHIFHTILIIFEEAQKKRSNVLKTLSDAHDNVSSERAFLFYSRPEISPQKS